MGKQSILITELVDLSIYTIKQAKTHVILTYHCGFTVLGEKRVGFLRVKIAFQWFCWESFIVLSANGAVLYVHGMLLCQWGMSLKFIWWRMQTHTISTPSFMTVLAVRIIYACGMSTNTLLCIMWSSCHYSLDWNLEPFKQAMCILLWMP